MPNCAHLPELFCPVGRIGVINSYTMTPWSAHIMSHYRPNIRYCFSTNTSGYRFNACLRISSGNKLCFVESDGGSNVDVVASLPVDMRADGSAVTTTVSEATKENG